MKNRIATVLVFLLLLMIFPMTSVSANSGPPTRGITIEPFDCDYDSEPNWDFPGNIDILVRLDDFDTDDFGVMTDQYKEFYPFYEDIEYLDSMPTGWTSFSAYFQDEEQWGYADYFCGMQFGNDETVKKISTVKVVYFADDGTTIEISEDIEVPNVYFYQRRNTLIYIDTETYEITGNLEPAVDAYFILTMVGVMFLMTFSILIEFIIALLFKVKGPKPILHVLLINLLTQSAMYIYFFIYFDTYHGDYRLQIYLFELLILVVEFGYLYVILKKLFSWKKLALFVLVANIISYILGLMIFG